VSPIASATKYSIVVPVYKSASVVGRTIDRIVAFAEQQRLDYELVLVNDSPPDDAWEVIARKARENPRLTALCLMRNYGQHTAVLCGLRNSTGDYVVTLDDDLQNPPEEIRRLIETAEAGSYDLVIGSFRQERHPPHRRLGSRIVAWINERVFGKPKNFAVTNFRLIRRDVVNRVCAHRTIFPYITGLVLLYSVRRANVEVEHLERAGGQSTYDLTRIVRLVFTILFSYSGFPLQLVATAGLVLSAASFLVGATFAVRGFIVTSVMPGWTSLVTLLSFFNSFVFLMLSMLGEYVVRLQQQITTPENYTVVETIRVGG